MGKKITQPEGAVLKTDVAKIVKTEHHDPFSILGNHVVEVDGKSAVAIRVFDPAADSIEVLDKSDTTRRWSMKKTHKEGFFEVVIPEREETFAYLLRRFYGGVEVINHDPYCFLPVLSEYDIYLFNQGTHHHVYDKLGAHHVTLGDVRGTHFAVWAPNAKRVSVVGAFNNWDGRNHPMRMRGGSGVWELFIPEIEPGTIYKYEIKTAENHILLKADPYAFYAERRPKTASVVADLNSYEWNDAQWLERRASLDILSEPISVYEVHLGSWVRKDDPDDPFYNFREMAEKLIPYVAELGFTHIELLPVMDHPLDASWGYQVSGYFAVTPRFGEPEDFMTFVDTCHRHGIGVILDWVPGHFPKDDSYLGYFDGTHLYEHADPRQGEHKEWGTYVFNFGRNEVKNFLIGSAMFWLDKYHVDGLRVDAVASMLYLNYSREEGEWIPNKYGGAENLDAVAFLREANSIIFEHYPGVIMSAEESTAWPMVSRPVYLGGLGFNFKWNMGWMHDTLLYMSKESVHRKYHQNLLTFGLLYAFHENFILPFSHDEVVHGKGAMLSKMTGDYWQKFANLRLLYAYMYGHPGKKLLFMGSEFGQWNEWNFDQSLDWVLLDFDPHKGIKTLLGDLNRMLKAEPSLHEIDFSYEGFEWIDINDTENSTLSFLRRGRNRDDYLVFALNFTPVIREKYLIGVDKPVMHREILNTDSTLYGGGDVGNGGGVMATEKPWHGRPYSMEITLPPLAAVVFKPRQD